jgi:hypothetical protein
VVVRAKKTAVEAKPDRDCLRVGRSRIEGKGVFAKRRIPKGTRVIAVTGAPVPVATLLTAAASGSPVR